MENLGISKPSFSVLEKFKHLLVVIYINYNCAVLFLYKCIGCLFMIENETDQRPHVLQKDRVY